MKKNKERKVEIRLDNVGSKLVIKAQLVRDIYIVQAVKRADREDRNTDVIIKDVFGNEQKISSEELIKNYRYYNGKPIDVHGISSRYKYYVFKVREDDNFDEFYIMKIPSNCYMRIMNRVAVSGDFVIFDTNGEEFNSERVSEYNIYKMSEKIFKKLFRITDTENKLSELKAGVKIDLDSIEEINKNGRKDNTKNVYEKNIDDDFIEEKVSDDDFADEDFADEVLESIDVEDDEDEDYTGNIVLSSEQREKLNQDNSEDDLDEFFNEL